MTFLIVGASAGLGRALAGQFAANGHALVIVSSDLRDLKALAGDLSAQYSVPIECVELDLAESHLPMTHFDAALTRLPPLRGILLPAGMTRMDDRVGASDADVDAITRVNYISICRLVIHCLPYLSSGKPAGLIVGFGSIAAERGRSRNVAYAAAKRALRSYFESLRHTLAPRGIVVQFYTLGYMDTDLAFSLRTPVPKVSPERVAKVVYRRRERDFGHAFYPGIWRPICSLVRALPWPLFRRLSF